MKTPLGRRIKFVFVILLISAQVRAQVPDSTYHERLYYLCKAWGHVKYYHTQVSTGTINWDDQLFTGLNGAKYSTSNTEFNDSLLTMLYSAGPMGTSADTLPIVPDSFNLNIDKSWINNSIFSSASKSFLDTVSSRFRPQSNAYVMESMYGGAPSFDGDDQYYIGPDYPSENQRLLSLFRYWNIIHHFFPYKDIMDQNWDTTLDEFIPKFSQAADAKAYHLAVKQLTMRINDSHGDINSSVYRIWKGSRYPPYLVRYIENEMVITKVLPWVTDVKKGDVIKGIEGMDIYTLRDSVRPYAYGSNNDYIEHEISEIIQWGGNGNFQITIDDGDSVQSKTLSRNSVNYGNLVDVSLNQPWSDTLVDDSCLYGIVDMAVLDTSQIDSMFSDLWGTDAIIFDLRNYPKASIWMMIDYLFATGPIHFVSFTIPDLTYPGTLLWYDQSFVMGTSNPYAGKLIILFDERTLSAAEYTCMALETHPGALKIGSRTAAADGNVAAVYLPGYISTYFTSLGVYYPDQTATQRVGIVPDFEVRPTITGIREGRDEVLEFALNCSVFPSIEIIVDVTDVELYPNPTSDQLVYKLHPSYRANRIELVNLTGQVVLTSESHSSIGVVDLSEVEQGIYLIKFTIDDMLVTKKVIKN